MIYFIAILSMMAHNVSRILDAVKKYKGQFSIITWIINPTNYLYMVMSFLCVLMLILSIDLTEIDIINISGIKFNGAYIAAIIIGYMPASVVNAILQKFKSS